MSNTSPTLCHAFQATVAAYPDEVAVRTLGGAVSITWRDYAARVESIAAGLAGLGVQAGDTVAIMLTNRPEFHLVDTAVLHLGATPFSIYNTNTAPTIDYLFENADNRVVVCEQQFVPVLLEAKALGSKITHIVCVDGDQDGTVGLAEVEAAPAIGFDFRASWQAVRPSDLATIVYTSGTTGMPKGVELTHSNILRNIECCDVWQAGPQEGERVLSYLPDAHLANRWLSHYAAMVHGSQVTDVPNPRDVLAALLEVRPAMFIGVPMTWYKLKTAIDIGLARETDPAVRAGTERAIALGLQKVRADQEGRALSEEFLAEFAEADRSVLTPLRARIGLDQVRLPVSGAAPVSAETLEFMMALGLRITEAWGSTESSCAATTNPIEAIRIGTVGKAIPDVEVTLAEDGELLVRGPIVMRGYRKDPEKTAETIDADGWLHTGDLGSIDEDGYVTIVGRKKDLIINSSGKNMSPSNIENAVLAGCPQAGLALAIGDRRPFVTALIVLDPDAAAAYAARHQLTDGTPAALAGNAEFVAEIQQGIDRANAKLSRVEQVRAFTIVPEYWLPGSDVLTPTMKVRRRPSLDRYAGEIESMYAR